MKKEFSTAWKASSQTRKQRKYRFNSPLHIKHKFLSANLSKELRKKLGRRSLEVRKQDTIKIMRGEFKKKTGKVASVDLKRTRIVIEGIQRKKKDGTKVNVYFNPSNMQILEIKEDKYRLAKKNQSKSEEEENKPKEEKTKTENKQEGKK